MINDRGIYAEDINRITDCKKRFGKTLSYVLSACGYDVWLSNIRGNKYTTNHTILDTNDPEFWKFSLDELSQIDLPAVIDYVSTVANSSKVAFIAYSMGTSLMFQLLAAKPDYSKVSNDEGTPSNDEYTTYFHEERLLMVKILLISMKNVF